MGQPISRIRRVPARWDLLFWSSRGGLCLQDAVRFVLFSSIAGRGQGTKLHTLNSRVIEAHADARPPRSIAKQLLTWFEFARISLWKLFIVARVGKENDVCFFLLITTSSLGAQEKSKQNRRCFLAPSKKNRSWKGCPWWRPALLLAPFQKINRNLWAEGPPDSPPSAPFPPRARCRLESQWPKEHKLMEELPCPSRYPSRELRKLPHFPRRGSPASLLAVLSSEKWSRPSRTTHKNKSGWSRQLLRPALHLRYLLIEPGALVCLGVGTLRKPVCPIPTVASE